ncbi:MAG TPA: hypothetical protein VMZ28_21225 [Kofleriaceae bacterium]|nr:hypothetical protein [Kofleriaceae bacterium]
MRPYAIVVGVVALGIATGARAESPPSPNRVAVLVEGAASHHLEVEQAVTKALAAQATVIDAARLTPHLPPAGHVLHDEAASALRRIVDATRLVVVHLHKQGKDVYLITVRGVDESGISRRFGHSPVHGIAEQAVRVVGELPPLPEPPKPPPPPPPPDPPPVAAAPVPEPKPEKVEPPPPAPVKEPVVAEAAPAPSPALHYPSKRRRHPYALLVGGAVAFFLPYFATIGLAAHYEGYNPNAGRAGYAPLAGPFLARQKLNDKDLRDGADAGLLAGGVVQVVAFSVLVAGILYCAIGEKIPPKRVRDAQRWTPLVSLGSQEARVGAVLSW